MCVSDLYVQGFADLFLVLPFFWGPSSRLTVDRDGIWHSMTRSERLYFAFRRDDLVCCQWSCLVSPTHVVFSSTNWISMLPSQNNRKPPEMIHTSCSSSSHRQPRPIVRMS